MLNMETEIKAKETKKAKPVVHHQGHAVKKVRMDQGLTQEQFGKLVGMSQETVCRYEDKEVIEPEILSRIALKLNVPIEFIQNMEDSKPLTEYIFENNTFSDNAVMATNQNQGDATQNLPGGLEQTLNTTIEELKKSMEENRTRSDQTISLYEQIIKDYKDKIEKLEKELSLAKGEK